MHLSECTDLFSETNTFDAEVTECVKEWLWKTKTEFYGWDDRLQLDPLFGALCWSYSIAGICMFIVQPKWTKRSSFPYQTFALVLICVQGPLSFIADYLNMTNDTVFHVIDRFMACTNMILLFGKLAAFYFHSRPSNFYASLASTSFAVLSFMNSQDAQELHDPEGFIFWHNMWHLYPIQCIVIEMYDAFVLGDYDDEMSRAGSSTRRITASSLRVPGILSEKLKSFLLYGDSSSSSSSTPLKEKKGK
mmetsp:Transcript_9450/g.13880  ORF Transcript_9450/g.13880 Transcript_9450/m.13880 type:complete len:248 (-) Transcript_9450:1664-2407(-)